MTCRIPDSESRYCYFDGLCEYHGESMELSYADLDSSNCCFSLHANYKPGRLQRGGMIPFKIFGALTPQSILPDIDSYPDIIPFEVTGERKRGEEFFYASGTIDKYTVKPFQIIATQKPGSKFVNIQVWLPSEALLAQRIAR